MTGRYRHWWVGIVNLVAVLALYFAVPVQTTPSVFRLLVELGVSLAAVGVAGRVLFREVVRLSTGAEGRLDGLRLVLLLEIVMLVFALAYYTMAVKSTNQMAGIHTRLDSLYFTVTTMTTVGYGDIHPIGQLARGIATVHLLFNLVFIAAFAGLVRRNVAARTTPPPEQAPKQGPGDEAR